MAGKKSSLPQGRWAKVRDLGDRNVGQAWLYIVTDTRGEHEGQYVYKVLKSVDQVARRNRFAIEIKVTNVLESSGLSVVRVVDSGTPVGERPYMVTPYFPRGDLRAYAATENFKNNLPLTLDFVERLAKVIKQIHETAVHRDLKPENVLIDAYGRPVLCDFGLCLPLWDSEDTARNSDIMEQVGSRHYMAPEALAGFPSVKNPLALDVYSVGKIAYELAVGRVLPGIELPIHDYDLTVGHAGADDWYLFNAVIRGLVDHDPSIRMNTWEKLSTIIEQARMTGNESRKIDPERFEIRVARALEGSADAQEAKRVRDFHAKRESYRESLLSAVAAAIANDSHIQRLSTLANGNDRLEIAGGRRSSDLVARLPGYPTASPGEVRDSAPLPGISVRLRIGRTPGDDPMPTLEADLIWRRDFQELRLTFALYRAEYGPPPAGGVIAALIPVPEVISLDWATLGDETYIAQARIIAAKMARQFTELVAQTLEPLPE